jgi:hypothetical protein
MRKKEMYVDPSFQRYLARIRAMPESKKREIREAIYLSCGYSQEKIAQLEVETARVNQEKRAKKSAKRAKSGRRQRKEKPR